jgi:hypothetical protein
LKPTQAHKLYNKARLMGEDCNICNNSGWIPLLIQGMEVDQINCKCQDKKNSVYSIFQRLLRKEIPVTTIKIKDLA